MKYLLMIHVNPAALDALPQEERDEILAAHDRLTEQITESGELVGFAALADPVNSKTVKVRDGVPAISDGPYIESKEFLAGYYVVDCETDERAAELAAMIPDARYTAVEVRPVMHTGGTEI